MLAKKNSRDGKMPKTVNSQPAKTILKPYVLLQSGFLKLDKLLTGGFKAGEITCLEGDSSIISEIPVFLCVNTQMMFKSPSVYIDSGCKLNPYKISGYARQIELRQKKVLENIYISRAFTLYQLSTIIQENLESLIKKNRPCTLIIGDINNLHLDQDIKTDESQMLLKNNIKKIQFLTKKYNLVTVFTGLNKQKGFNQKLKKIIHNNVDEIIHIEQRENCFSVNLLKKHKSDIIFNCLGQQLTLNDFGMEVN